MKRILIALLAGVALVAQGVASEDGTRVRRVLTVSTVEGVRLGEVVELAPTPEEEGRLLVATDEGALVVRAEVPTEKELDNLRIEDRGTGWWLQLVLAMPSFVREAPPADPEERIRWSRWLAGELAAMPEPSVVRIASSSGLAFTSSEAEHADGRAFADSLSRPFTESGEQDLPPDSTRRLLRLLVSLQERGAIDFFDDRPLFLELVGFLALAREESGDGAEEKAPEPGAEDLAIERVDTPRELAQGLAELLNEGAGPPAAPAAPERQ